MKRLLYILICLATFGIGLQLGSEAADSTALPSASEIVVQPRFLHLRGYGDYADFKSSGSAPMLADYCFGCTEIGDIAVDHYRFKTSEQHTLDGHFPERDGEIVESGLTKDADGQVIGERRLTCGPDGQAKLVWIAGDEHWSIRASRPELAVEFENSPEFREWRNQPYPGE